VVSVTDSYARDQLGADLNPTLARPEFTRFELSVRCTHSFFTESILYIYIFIVLASG
jgi:hypothetical protein